MTAKETQPRHPPMMKNIQKWLRDVEIMVSEARGPLDRFETPPDNSGAQALDPLLMARQLIALYRKRNELFSELGASDAFGDPAWNMLVDLFVETRAGRRVSVSSLCIGSMAPQTTALRHIAQLVQKGVLIRTPDEDDSRRIFISLSPAALRAMERLFLDHGM